MSEIAFTKMHGLGNDFMVVEDLDESLRLDREQIKALSDRHTGVGFDQLLVVAKASIDQAEFDYRIFNANGEEVEHCGNGARCFARYVTDRGLTASAMIPVNTQAGLIHLRLRDDGQVTVQMGVPDFEPSHIPFMAQEQADYYSLQVAEQELQVGAVGIGNPHVLLQVPSIDDADVPVLGPAIERHERFPQRVNVGFMEYVNRQQIRLRVYERGVGETQACGTGACAAVAIAHRQGLLDKTAVVSLLGGDLHIHWPNVQSSIEMTGPCSTVFVGQTTV